MRKYKLLFFSRKEAKVTSKTKVHFWTAKQI